jgi:hypothetical protein
MKLTALRRVWLSAENRYAEPATYDKEGNLLTEADTFAVDQEVADILISKGVAEAATAKSRAGNAEKPEEEEVKENG